MTRCDVAVDRCVVEQQVQVADLWILRHLGEPDLAAGVLVTEPAYDRRQDHVRHALERADVDPAIAGLEPLDGIGQRLGLRQQVASLLEDHGAERRDPYRPGTARPLEHRASNGPLQGGDLLTDRRLRVAQSRGRSAERALLDDGSHRRQMPQFNIDHEPQYRC